MTIDFCFFQNKEKFLKTSFVRFGLKTGISLRDKYLLFTNLRFEMFLLFEQYQE